MPVLFIGLYFALVLLSRPAKALPVTIKYFFIATGKRNPYTITMPYFRSKVASDDNGFASSRSLAREYNNTLIAVVTINPFKAAPFKVNLPQGGLFTIKM